MKPGDKVEALVSAFSFFGDAEIRKGQVYTVKNIDQRREPTYQLEETGDNHWACTRFKPVIPEGTQLKLF